MFSPFQHFIFLEYHGQVSNARNNSVTKRKQLLPAENEKIKKPEQLFRLLFQKTRGFLCFVNRTEKLHFFFDGLFNGLKARR